MRKSLLLGLNFVLAASLILALVLTSCSKTTTTTQVSSPTSTTTQTTTTANVTTTVATTKVTTTTTSSTAAGTTPQYGGTLNVATDWMNQDPGGWDGNLTPTPWSTAVYDDPFMPWLMLGNVEKFGPRGTNQYSFDTTEYTPEQFLMGGDGIGLETVTIAWASRRSARQQSRCLIRPNWTCPTATCERA